jgi:hypothetical protein
VPDADRIVARRWWGLCGLLLVMGWALFLRLYRLRDFYPGLWKDEADTGEQTIRYMNLSQNLSDLHLFRISTWGGVSEFHWFISSWLVRLTGATAYGLRLVNVIYAVAGLPVMYLLARRLGMRRSAALVAVFLTGTLHWPLVQSRIGVAHPLMLLTVPVEVLLAMLAMESRRIWWWVGLGLWTDFMLWGFVGTQPIFLAIVFWGVWLLLTSSLQLWSVRRLRGRASAALAAAPEAPADADTSLTNPRWRFHPRILVGAAIALVVTIVGMLPWLSYYRANPTQWNIRARETFIYYPGLDITPESCTPERAAARDIRYPVAYCHWLAAHPTLPGDAWTILTTNTRAALGMFTVRSDSGDSIFDNVFDIQGQPLLLPLEGGIFLIATCWIILRGLATILIPPLQRFRRPADSLIFLWFATFLVTTEVLTFPTPQSQHGLPMVPAFCLLIGLATHDAYNGLAWLGRLLRRDALSPMVQFAGRSLVPLAYAASVVVLVVVARQSWRWYFNDYYNNPATYSQFNAPSYQMGDFAASLTGSTPTLLIYSTSGYTGEVLRFMAPSVQIVPALGPDGSTIKVLPGDQVPAHPQGIIFRGPPGVIQPYIDLWRRRVPNLRLQTRYGRYHEPLFQCATVPMS